MPCWLRRAHMLARGAHVSTHLTRHQGRPTNKKKVQVTEENNVRRLKARPCWLLRTSATHCEDRILPRKQPAQAGTNKKFELCSSSNKSGNRHVTCREGVSFETQTFRHVWSIFELIRACSKLNSRRSPTLAQKTEEAARKLWSGELKIRQKVNYGWQQFKLIL